MDPVDDARVTDDKILRKAARLTQLEFCFSEHLVDLPGDQTAKQDVAVWKVLVDGCPMHRGLGGDVIDGDAPQFAGEKRARSSVQKQLPGRVLITRFGSTPS